MILRNGAGKRKQSKKSVNRYPWESWFRPGRTLKLRHGVDYQCLTHAMAGIIRNAASMGRHAVWVSVVIHDDMAGLTLTVLRKRSQRSKKSKRSERNGRCRR